MGMGMGTITGTGTGTEALREVRACRPCPFPCPGFGRACQRGRVTTRLTPGRTGSTQTRAPTRSPNDSTWLMMPT